MKKEYLSDIEIMRFVGFIIFSLIIVVLATVAIEDVGGIFTPEFAFGCMISYISYVLSQLPALVKTLRGK